MGICGCVSEKPYDPSLTTVISHNDLVHEQDGDENEHEANFERNWNIELKIWLCKFWGHFFSQNECFFVGNIENDEKKIEF